MVTELSHTDARQASRRGIVEKILNGEVFVARKELQSFDLMGIMVEASLAGIAKSVGSEVAERVRQLGFERIHEVVPAADILKITDGVYEEMLRIAPHFLQSYIPKAFPEAKPLYFELYPNVRFHIPYALAADHRKTFEGFRGEGKVVAHGPHRDSWLNCPDNGVNVWIAIGPVQQGNGLTIFKDDNHRKLSFKPTGDIADGEKLHKPLTFSLEPGDAIIFHTDHLHGSELNRTDQTRFVVSFRITFGKPRFPNGHSHEYVHAGLNNSFMKPLAKLPAKLQRSYALAVLKSVNKRAKSIIKRRQPRINDPHRVTRTAVDDEQQIVSLALSDVPVGTISGVTKNVCVARLSETECVAISRRCPHRGGDFSNGWIDNGQIVCPWHNLNFHPASGASPCAALPSLKRYACEVENGRILVDTRRRIDQAA